MCQGINNPLENLIIKDPFHLFVFINYFFIYIFLQNK